MRHVVSAAAEAAFERYSFALALRARTPGSQLDLFNDASRLVAEWRAIWIACLVELTRLGVRNER